MTTRPDDVTLPCGCDIVMVETGSETYMQIARCRDGCEYLRFAIEETTRQGKPIEKELAP